MTVTCKKKRKRGVTTAKMIIMNSWLKMNLDMKTDSAGTVIRKNKAVDWSSSRTKMWERPFMALKKMTTQRRIACTCTGKGTPPAVRLMAMVTMAAKETAMFKANLLLNSIRKSLRRLRSISLPKPDHPAAQFFFICVVRGEDNYLRGADRFEITMKYRCPV